MNKRKLPLFFLALLILASALTACNTTSDPTTEPVILDANGYPVQAQSAADAYPTLDNYYNDLADLKAPAEAHTPQAGTASISGLIYVPSRKSVVKNTLIYLVPAEGENKDIVPGILIGDGMQTRGDVISRTDDQGVFYIDNIPPGNYFLVVSFQNNIILTAISEIDLNPRLLKLEADTATPLGLIVSPGD